MEVVPGNPTLIMDGAHNPAGMKALVSSLRQVTRRQVVAVVSVLSDKDLEQMATLLATVCDSAIATQSDNPRAAPAEQVANALQRAGISVQVTHSPQDAVTLARRSAPSDGVVLICGSLYLLAQVRNTAMGVWSDDPGMLAREVPGNRHEN